MMKHSLVSILIVAIFLTVLPFGLALSTGARNASTIVDNASVGTGTWNNPMNANISDNVYATLSPSAGAETHYLKATNFSFSIPAGSTINGINVSVERQTDYYGKDKNVRLIAPNGEIGAVNLADLVNEWPRPPDEYKYYGNSTYVWGETWTSSDINGADFGVLFSAKNTGDDVSVLDVDHISITVYYTEAPEDTCTPPASGNYIVDASDNCAWTENDEIPGNVSIIGTGTGNLFANWTFTGLGNSLSVHNGSTFVIHAGGGIGG